MQNGSSTWSRRMKGDLEDKKYKIKKKTEPPLKYSLN